MIFITRKEGPTYIDKTKVEYVDRPYTSPKNKYSGGFLLLKKLKKNLSHKSKKYIIPYNPEAPKKVLLSKACLKQLVSLLLDVEMKEAEKFLYLLPLSVKDQLVPLIIEEYHKRCAKE